MTGTWQADLLLGAAVLLGASVQRVAGIGFALVAAPALVLMEGPVQGVLLANSCSAAISLIGLASEWRRVRLRAMLPLIAAAACSVPIGAWAAARLPGPVLLSSIGAMVCAAVLLVARGTRLPVLHGRAGALAAGGASGFMNASAGVGGPAFSLYALGAGWPVRDFVPNAQFYGVAVNAFSLTVKGLPELAAPAWAAAALGIAGGAVAGAALSRRISEARSRPLVLLLALAGGLITLAKGLWGR